jgi:hypothetical protein
MSVKLQIEETLTHLTARFTGAGVAEEGCQEFELIAEHCKRANKNKLLLDITEVHANIFLADRYFFGEEMQIFAHYNLKVAVVCSLEQLDPQRFTEKVAQNRGVNLRVFKNVKDAEGWLSK